MHTISKWKKVNYSSYRQRKLWSKYTWVKRKILNLWNRKQALCNGTGKGLGIQMMYLIIHNSFSIISLKVINLIFQRLKIQDLSVLLPHLVFGFIGLMSAVRWPYSRYALTHRYRLLSSALCLMTSSGTVWKGWLRSGEHLYSCKK